MAERQNCGRTQFNTRHEWERDDAFDAAGGPPSHAPSGPSTAHCARPWPGPRQPSAQAVAHAWPPAPVPPLSWSPSPKLVGLSEVVDGLAVEGLAEVVERLERLLLRTLLGRLGAAVAERLLRVLFGVGGLGATVGRLQVVIDERLLGVLLGLACLGAT
eukprot:12358202-Alexandrium_andersonii.AAC.1